jgi:hypothetical protein
VKEVGWMVNTIAKSEKYLIEQYIKTWEKRKWQDRTFGFEKFTRARCPG